MRTRIRNVHVFTGEQITGPGDIQIDGDRIVPADGTPVDEQIDGTGMTLMPGLIDAHTHVFDGDLAQALRFGVTTELDMFCLPGNLARQLRTVADCEDVADIRSAGTLATAPEGHPTQIITDDMRAAYPDAVGDFDTITEPEQATGFVAARVAEGSDYIKIVIDGGEITGDNRPTLGTPTAAALVEAAHASGLKAIAHTVTAGDTVTALDAGVDGIAHLWFDLDATDPISRDLITRIVEQDVFVTTTLTYIEAITGDRGGRELVDDSRIGPLLPPQAHAAVAALSVDRSEGLRNALTVAEALHRAGATLLAGTDANVFAPFHGASMHREVLLLTQAGMSAAQALAAATVAPAERFDLFDRGRIADGHRADLILLDGDPTEDVTATRSIVEVWRAGVRQKR